MTSFTSLIYSANDLDFKFKYTYKMEIDSISNPDCTTEFYSISRDGTIKLWSLANDTIFGGDIIMECPGNSLSIGGNSDCPTFFTTDHPGLGIRYYDALLGWVEIPTSVPLINNGSYKNDHYFQRTWELYHFDGTDLTVITSLFPEKFIVADIAVDTFGRAWCFIGNTDEDTSNLNIYDRDGLIQSYETPINNPGIYGSFFLNDILYIGVGESGPYANSIVPITIVDNTVQLGIPIPFIYDDYFDMASCHKSKNNPITLITDISSDAFSFYPNPTNTIVYIESKLRIVKIEIYNAAGILLDTNMNNAHNTVDLSIYPSGLYRVKLFTTKSNYTESIIKL